MFQKRTIRPLLISATFLVFLLSPAVAFAQDGQPPFELPPTAGEGVQWLATVGVMLFAGLLGSTLTDALKRIPWLKEDDRSKLSGPLAGLVAGVLSVGFGFVSPHLVGLAQYLDRTGLWGIVLAAWPVAWGVYELQVRRKIRA